MIDPNEAKLSFTEINFNYLQSLARFLKFSMSLTFSISIQSKTKPSQRLKASKLSPFLPQSQSKTKTKRIITRDYAFQNSNVTANFNPRRQSCVTNFAKQRRALYTYTYKKMTVNLSQFIRILKIYST